jgi:hypothetical protein
MPLSWFSRPRSQLCIATGNGAVTRADIESYLAGTERQGATGYEKLVDITACTLTLSTDDLEQLSQRLIRYGRDHQAGPVAMIVATPLNLDMVVLLKQRVGDRPFRIFTSALAARSWLAGYGESYHPTAFASNASPRRWQPLAY